MKIFYNLCLSYVLSLKTTNFAKRDSTFIKPLKQ